MSFQNRISKTMAGRVRPEDGTKRGMLPVESVVGRYGIPRVPFSRAAAPSQFLRYQQVTWRLNWTRTGLNWSAATKKSSASGGIGSGRQTSGPPVSSGPAKYQYLGHSPSYSARGSTTWRTMRQNADQEIEATMTIGDQCGLTIQCHVCLSSHLQRNATSRY